MTTRKLLSAAAVFIAATTLSAGPASAAALKPAHPKLAAQCVADVRQFTQAVTRWERSASWAPATANKAMLAATNKFDEQLWQLWLKLRAAGPGVNGDTIAEEGVNEYRGSLEQFGTDLTAASSQMTQLVAEATPLLNGWVCSFVAH
jgi:hypothetical protein